MKLTLNKIAAELCKREGKKSQAKIHDMREALKCLVDWEAQLLLDDSVLLDDQPIRILRQLASDRAGKLERKASK